MEEPMKLRWGLVLTSTLFLSLFLSGHADAQQKQGTPARVAWVSVLSLAQVASYLDAFRSGLAAEGYVEGSDVEVLARSADGDPARLSGRG
jgi:putative ABC transport system substrate-binding protein